MKRYEALYIAPNMCDGIFDNKTNEYLDYDTIEDLLNNKDYDSIWEERFKKENEKVKQLQRELKTHPKIIFANKVLRLLESAKELTVNKENIFQNKE